MIFLGYFEIRVTILARNYTEYSSLVFNMCVEDLAYILGFSLREGLIIHDFDLSLSKFGRE
jgi:hypothetical protein